MAAQKVLNTARLRILARQAQSIHAFATGAREPLLAQINWLRDQPFYDDDAGDAMPMVDGDDWCFATARDGLAATARSVLANGNDADDIAARQQYMSHCYFTLAGLECAIAGTTTATTDDNDGPPPHCSIVRALDRDELASLLAYTVEDIAAFSREKHGVSAEVDLRVTADGGNAAACSLVEGPVAFIVAELLKNAHMATVKRHGILEVEDAPPIEINAAIGRRGGLRLTVADQGAGVVAGPAATAAGSDSGGIFDWGVTHSASDKEDRWRHSREMGAAMAGQGVGLPRSRVFAAFHGGTLRWTSNAASGGDDATTSFELHLPP